MEVQLLSDRVTMSKGTSEGIILRTTLLIRKLRVSPDGAQEGGHHRNQEAAEHLFTQRTGEANGSVIFQLVPYIPWLGNQGQVHVSPALRDDNSTVLPELLKLGTEPRPSCNNVCTASPNCTGRMVLGHSLAAWYKSK